MSAGLNRRQGRGAVHNNPARSRAASGSSLSAVMIGIVGRGARVNSHLTVCRLGMGGPTPSMRYFKLAEFSCKFCVVGKLYTSPCINLHILDFHLDM